MVSDTRRCIYNLASRLSVSSKRNATSCIGPTVRPTLRAVPLPHAILVSLCEQPGSGYELARRFEHSIGYFWAATHQQIYRTLRTMEADGWVHATVIPQRGRPDRRDFRVTDSGRAELTRWIVEPLTGRGSTLTDGRTRELAVKLRGLAHGAPAASSALRAQVSRLRDERAELVDAYRGFEKKQFADPSTLRDSALHKYLVLRGGIRAEEGSIEWLDEVLTALGGRDV